MSGMSISAARLAALPIAGKVVAERIGVTAVAVSRYRSGQRTPTAELAAKLETEFGIPADGWSEPVTSAQPEQAALGGDHAERTKRLAAELLEALEAEVRAVRGDDGLTHLERTRRLTQLAQAVQRIGPLTGATLALSEEQILRSPAWRKLKEDLLEMLAEFPDAAIAFEGKFRHRE